MTRPSASELYQLFERSPIGMCRCTEGGRFVYVNPALVQMLGYESTEALLAVDGNRDIYVDPQARAKLIASYQPLGVVDGAIVRWRRRDGSQIAVRIYGQIVDVGGEVGFDVSILDVTDIEHANAELRDQRGTLDSTASILDMVVRQMPAMYWVVDRDLRIVRTGGAITDVLGYRSDQIIGKTLDEVHSSDPGSIDPVALHRRAVGGEHVMYTTDYRQKQLEVTVAPYRIGGVLSGAIGTCIDVTASRAFERRMVDAQRAESLGVLAGGLAHDFNNLLVAILGNADLGLRDTPASAPGRAALENIRNASLRAAELTDQLLAYAGRREVVTARVRFGPVVDELLRISAVTIPANVTVKVEIAAGLGVLGDAPQIRQVMMNLFGNARDALGTRGGTISISARTVEHDGTPGHHDALSVTAGSYVEVAVTDDGPGMDAETRRHVFEPFFTTKASGHGLGLAAVLGIVRAHGGGLRVVSKPGAGASFQVLWPVAGRSGEHAVVSVPAARTVLVIDDEDLVRDVVARMIEDLGYAAVTARDGIAGLEVVDRQTVDAVLVDMTMPRLSGADVVAELRRRHPTLPIVLCSGYDRGRRGPVQADAYLPKPFRIEALEETLARLLP